jgi:hypothetical protein
LPRSLRGFRTRTMTNPPSWLGPFCLAVSEDGRWRPNWLCLKIRYPQL